MTSHHITSHPIPRHVQLCHLEDSLLTVLDFRIDVCAYEYTCMAHKVAYACTETGRVP